MRKEGKRRGGGNERKGRDGGGKGNGEDGRGEGKGRNSSSPPMFISRWRHWLWAVGAPPNE